VQHIRVRPGDAIAGPDPENRDALKIEGSTSKPATNIVVDHCTFSWALDEVASIWGPHDNITLSNNIFSEPLNDSYHPTKDGTGRLEPHGFNVLIDSSASGGRVTMVGNLLAHAVERNPLSRARELVFVNNLVYNRETRDIDIQSQSSRITKASLQGNVFLQGPDNDATTRPIYLRTSGTYRLYNGSKVYVKDTAAPDYGTSLSSWVVMTGGDLSTDLLTTSKPVWNDGLQVRSTASNGVYNHVIAYAGARPTDRDATDKRVISSVKNRSGQIINCVSANGSTRCQKNANGWASLNNSTRRLTLPSNPNGVASNGYTNLENWLHNLATNVQGASSGSSPASPASLSVN